MVASSDAVKPSPPQVVHDWLNGTSASKLLGSGSKPMLKYSTDHSTWTIDDLMYSNFPLKISDDIDLDPCKSGESESTDKSMLM